MAVIPSDVILMSSSTSMTSVGSTAARAQHDQGAFNNGAPNITLTPGCLVLRKSNSSFVPWNNPENVVSQETEAQIDVAINVYVLTVLFCVSAPANVINMLVFWRQGIQERINLILFSLAFTAFVTVLTNFVSYLDKMVAEYTPWVPSPQMFKFIVNNSLLVIAAFGYVSWFLCLVIAVERCVCILFPLRASTLISTRTMLIMIVTASIVIVGCHAVLVLRVRIGCVVDPVSGAVADANLPSQFYLDNKKLVEWMEGVGFGLILPGVCLFGVATATIITIRQLRAVSRWRALAMSGKNSQNTSSETGENSVTTSAKSGATSTTSANSVAVRELALTRMLIGISVFFILLTTPLFVIRTVVLIVPEVRIGGKYHNLHWALLRFGKLCFYLNATVNFFVYLSTGSRFRSTLRTFFPCRTSAAQKCSSGSGSAAPKLQQSVTTASELAAH